MARNRSRPQATPDAYYRGTKREKDLLAKAHARFRQAAAADSKQRQRERDDLSFYQGDGQWPEDMRVLRQGQPQTGGLNGMPPVPARPCLVINKVREPVKQVLNQERESDMGITLVAADDFAGVGQPIDDTEIELREGLIRRIQRDSQAADARTWAFGRAVIAGRGYYGVMTQFLEGKTNDQDVYIHRFYNQASVSLDPSHEQPDGSDAEWGFLGTDMPYDQYVSEFGEDDNYVSDADDEEFRALGDVLPDWFSASMGEDGDETRSCRVVDYFYTVRTPRELCTLSDGSLAWDDELPDKLPRGVKVESRRRVVEKRVKWAKLDGCQVLDETDWPSPFIPIVKVVGEELQPFDKERRFEGMVRPSRDSQASFNYMVTKWVEMIGLSPIPPFQITPTQIEGFELWYQSANTRALPYLPFNPDTQSPGPPARTNISTPIEAIAGSVQLFDQAIKSTTGVPDSGLGNIDPALKSGRAIKALLEQARRGTSNYLDNLRRSIAYEARIVNSLLYPIYGTRPGRLSRIVDGNGEHQTVAIGQAPTQAGQAQTAPKVYTLTKDANFNVAIKIGKSFDTTRQEETVMLGELIAAQPQLMGVFGDLFFKHQDGPGHKEMAERAKATLIPPVQALLKGDGAPDPQVAGMQAQLAQVQAELAQAQQQLQGKRIESQVKLQQTAMEIQSDQVIEKIKAGVALAVADLQATTSQGIAAMKAETEQLRQIIATANAQVATEQERRLEERQHEETASAHGRDHAHESMLEAQRIQHEREMAARVAETPPAEPTE
jgi:hypothetical protein